MSDVCSAHSQLTDLVSIKMLSRVIILSLAVTVITDDASEDYNEKYIENVQNQWKQYRNLVKDGFLYNDSFVVISDYDVTETSDVHTDLNRDALLGEVPKVDAADVADIPKLGFESTLMGMVNALQEIQSKGDQMMNAIHDQKKVLVKLRNEVKLFEID